MNKSGIKSKSELARSLGVSIGTVYNWYQRESLPDSLIMNKIIECLNIEAYELFLPMNSTLEVDSSMGELLVDSLNDLKKVEKHEDEILLAILARELVKEAKAIERFEVLNNSESTKLLIQSQKLRLFEISQKLTGNFGSKSPLAEKISKLSPVQAQVIESAIEGLLLSSANKSQAS